MRYFEKEGFLFADKGKDKLSFQDDEQVEIDHLIYRDSNGIKFEIKSIDLLDRPIVSDHRPLLAELSVVF